MSKAVGKSEKWVETTSGKPQSRSRPSVGRRTNPPKGIDYKKVTVGSVTVKVSGVPASEKSRNIKAGQHALARAKTAIITPGVKIGSAKGVPIFHADPDRPDLLVRVLDGKREYGVFKDGKFKKRAR